MKPFLGNCFSDFNSLLPNRSNIIKPIQDALVGVVFADDALISDVDSHRRFISEGIDLTNLPPLLIEGAVYGEECVYVRVSLSENLEVYL